MSAITTAPGLACSFPGMTSATPTPTPGSNTASSPLVACPSCGAQTSGKFCSECGVALDARRCAACQVELISGARFCHRCGLPSTAAAPPGEGGAGPSFSLPWVVAAIALLALVALVAGQQFGRDQPASQPPATATTDPSVSAPPLTGGVRGPDISNLSPEQRASMLYDRIMRYNEAGAQDSLRMFAPMAIAAYEMMGPLDADGRYDLGRIGEVSGDLELARAQADTILSANPNHLLGLILAARTAQLGKRDRDARQFLQRLVIAEPIERGKKLPEYERHAGDITAALDLARRPDTD